MSKKAPSKRAGKTLEQESKVISAACSAAATSDRPDMVFVERCDKATAAMVDVIRSEDLSPWSSPSHGESGIRARMWSALAQFFDCMGRLPLPKSEDDEAVIRSMAGDRLLHNIVLVAADLNDFKEHLVAGQAQLASLPAKQHFAAAPKQCTPENLRGIAGRNVTQMVGMPQHFAVPVTRAFGMGDMFALVMPLAATAIVTRGICIMLQPGATKLAEQAAKRFMELPLSRGPRFPWES